MTVAGPAREQRALLWLAVAAISWRWVLAMLTPVPAEDGVNYLWMAQQFASGNAAAALSEPFAPLWPLLVALPVACGVEPFFAGQLLGCVCGGLAVLPIAAIAERLRAGAGLPAAALAATSSVLARTAPEVMTEPLFVLLAALAGHAGLAGRPLRLGAFAAAAFLVRPEGALLGIAFALVAPRRAWRCVVPLAAAAAALGLWRWWCGHGFDPVPKLGFHGLRDDLGDERGAWFENLLRVPAAFFEAFGGAAVLVALALWPARRRAGEPSASSRVAAPLWLLLLLGTAAIAQFVVRRRFFLSWAPCTLPLAGAALRRFEWLGIRGRELLLALLCGLDLWTAWQGTMAGQDRIAERLVGRHLAARIEPGRTVTGDMTRVLWFAGQRPLPPRHFDAAALVTAASGPAVEYVVLHETGGRGVFADVAAGLRGTFERYDLPARLREVAERRGIAVFVRR